MSSFSVPRYRKNLINSRVQIGLRAIIANKSPDIDDHEMSCRIARKQLCQTFSIIGS